MMGVRVMLEVLVFYDHVQQLYFNSLTPQLSGML
jgi:hypothetical protein